MRPSNTALRLALGLGLALLACEQIQAPPPSICVARQGDRRASSMEVCSHLARLSCRLPDCVDAYNGYQSRVPPAEFDRLTACYVRATNCDQVDQCERACGPDGGMVTVLSDASFEAGAADVATDNPPTDSGTDAGPADSGPADAGTTDTGPTDSGPADAGPADSGPMDTGPTDAGPADAGATDLGAGDAATEDAGG